MEEGLVSGAEVVPPRVAVWRQGESVLRTAAVAGESYVAFAAIRRQSVPLVEPEPTLLLGGDELQHVRLPDVPEPVARFHEVVARVEVAVVLECKRLSARLRVDAETRGLVGPVCERDVEHLDIDLSDVSTNPLLED